MIPFVLILCLAADANPVSQPSPANAAGERPDTPTVRVAVFNIWELSREKLDQVDTKGAGANWQLRNAAEIIQRVRPDILLVNEIDHDVDGAGNAQLFMERYLAVSQRNQQPITFPHIYFEPVNTGMPSGIDFNNDGDAEDPDDTYGFGRYPGQYGMALFSRFPIDEKHARTFQRFLWKDMPGNLMPDGADGKPKWYAPPAVEKFRLSSKSHWDVPIDVGAGTLHLLCSHPTPPVFDGDEDRNGRRNHDEIRFWADYVAGGDRAGYLVDDEGRRGGLSDDARFVILGDLNADPHNGERIDGKPAIAQLLEHPRIQDVHPTSDGAPAARSLRGEKLPPDATCDFGRLDYVLLDKRLDAVRSGVFWPAPPNPLSKLVADRDASSDHRMVWVDVAAPKR